MYTNLKDDGSNVAYFIIQYTQFNCGLHVDSKKELFAHSHTFLFLNWLMLIWKTIKFNSLSIRQEINVNCIWIPRFPISLFILNLPLLLLTNHMNNSSGIYVDYKNWSNTGYAWNSIKLDLNKCIFTRNKLDEKNYQKSKI